MVDLEKQASHDRCRTGDNGLSVRAFMWASSTRSVTFKSVSGCASSFRPATLTPQRSHVTVEYAAASSFRPRDCLSDSLFMRKSNPIDGGCMAEVIVQSMKSICPLPPDRPGLSLGLPTLAPTNARRQSRRGKSQEFSPSESSCARLGYFAEAGIH
jgi:hypothetical protein